MQEARFGICGNIDASTAPEHNPIITLREKQVQNMILKLNQNPVPKDELLASYPALEQAIEKLIGLKVLRNDSKKVYVNFTLFSAQDKNLLFSICNEYATTLAAAVADKQSFILNQLSKCQNPLVDVKKLAFMVVGCYFLDWGVLELMRRWDFVVFGKPQAGGNSYTLWGEEAVKGSLKAVYWGGHSYELNCYLLHSFGDHESRRHTFPDLLYSKPKLEFEGSSEYQKLLRMKRLELGKEICEVLDTIGKKGLKSQKLSGILNWDSDKLNAVLALLKSLHYISDEKGLLQLEIPYFSNEDTELIYNIVSTLTPVVREWLTKNQAQIKADLAQVSPIKNGVPFKEVFNQIWHYIFGLTNKALAEKGLIYDTYCQNSHHPGHVPALIKGEVLEEVMARCQ